MAYDRADWHYGGDFPEGLAPECSGTHIGMFLAWAIQRGLEGELHRRMTRWWGVMACFSSVLIAACGSSDSENDGGGKSWQCGKITDIAACTCVYDVPTKFTHPVSECTPATGNAGRCCRSGAGESLPNCSCNSAYDVGCPNGTTEVEKCSGLPPP